MPLLTRSDFESAVKDALRHYTQPDLLAGSALLRASVLTRSGPAAGTPQALRALLVETAKALFAGERDQRLYRVLDLTYFSPAPKQEAAADRLGLSFSTYRRHLTAGVDRLIEWLWNQEQEAPQTEVSASDPTQATSPSTRPRLSIVILPFLNLSGDASVDYIVDGIVDSLITDLSTHVLGSFVISRSTAFAYKGRSVGARQVGSELGVRYVLEGSVSADESHIRVNVQLIHTETDEHLWAERFDKERRDIRQIQEEIVGRLSRSVGLEMVRAEAARRDTNTNSSDAEDLTMRGRALVHDVKQRQNAEEAIDLFRQALELDPDYVDAMAGIALARTYQVINLYRLEERDALLDEAELMVDRGMALSPDHFAILKARGLLLRARGRFSDALVAAEALIARNPVEPTAYKEIGLNKLYLGETQAAVEWFRRADAIAPRDPDRWTWLQGLGRALMQLGHDSEAVTVLSQAMDSNPGYVRGKAWLAAAEALSGDVARAERHLAEYAAAEPEMTVRRFAEERSSVPLEATSAVYRRECERILDGLRLAGMPDRIDGSRTDETIQPQATRSGAGELSEPVSELIGREAELSEVTDLVRTHHLVTLVGEGGIGKTRLGIEVARHLLPEFADGARVAELGPLSDPELVPIAVATALGLELRAGAMSAERVANALAGKQLMLVLDSCEHVIDAAANMARALLHANAAIRVLATSREPLRTEGECLYRLPPLAVPATDTGDLEELLSHGAVLLFVTRAREADPRFSVDGRIGAAAAAICRRLDGIPLAIELAAARGAALGIEEVASRLDDRFHLLTGGRRTALPRHQTLRATLDWSYQLLFETERIVLRRLAIFAGGFNLAAATAVASSPEITATDVIDGVANLVTKSLVTPDVSDAPARYRLLETTRAYVLEKLVESGELDSVARRHAEYYRDLFEQGAAEWETQSAAQWSAAHKPRIDNLRAALDWAFSPRGDASIGVTLTVLSVPLWMHSSLLSECRGRVEQALSSLGSQSARDMRHEMRLHAALGASLIYTKGPTPGTGAAWTSALEIAEKLEDTKCQLQALRGLWAYRLNSGEYRVSLELAQRFCRVAARPEVDPADLPVGGRMIGTSLHYLGDQTDARRHIERMLADYIPPVYPRDTTRFQFDQRVTARATLPRILWLQGFPDQAMRTAQTNVEDARAIDHALSLCNALADAACPIALFTGDLEAGERFVTMLLDHSGKHAFGFWYALGHTFEAILAIKRGDVITGLPLLRGALDDLRQTGFLHCYPGFLGAFAEASGRAEEVSQGLVAIEEALVRSERTEGGWCVAELLRIKGDLVLQEGGPNSAGAAEDHFAQALDVAHRQGALSWELRAATSLARLWRDQGRNEDAYRLLAPVYGRFTEGFETADLRAAKALISEFHARTGGLAKAPSVPEVAGGPVAAPLHPLTNHPEPVSEPPFVGGARAIGSHFTPDTGTAVAAAISQPLDKPSIVVLPFQNMSGDPEQEYFADGMVEEIITALSRIRWLFVIARNSSFSYKRQALDVKRVGRELGVRYVLEGSVRKAGGRLRIAAQLIDAVNGAHLWADHFDGSLKDVFDFQDKVASNVAGVIEPALQAAETARSVARPTDDLTAYDLYLRAYAMALPSAARFVEALRLLELAIDRDPCYGPALAWAAFCCNRLVIDGRSEDPAAHRLKGTDFARRALEVAGDDPAILANAAYALAYFGEDIGAMIALVDRALVLNPSFARGWHISGVLRVYAGQPDIAIEHAEASLRLSPRARVGWALFTIGAAHFYARRFAEAVPKLLLAMQEDPSLPNPYRYLAACYAHMGRLDEAREIFEQLQAVTAVAIPDLAYLRNAEHRELYLAGLRLAAGEGT